MSNSDDSDRLPLAWRTRWALGRNRVLGSAAFQSWAARMPVFQTIARRKAARQFDLIAGFVYTQIAHVFVRTGLLPFLREGPRTASAIAAFLSFGPEATDRILKAGAAIGLAESPQEDLWTLGETGAELSANEGAMAMIRHHDLLYRDLADPVAALSAGSKADTELADFWTYAPAGACAGEAAPYSDLMRATQPMVWRQIIGRYAFSRHRRMLDIGGGSGAFAEAVGTATPKLELGIFDLPDVVPLAERRFSGSALASRVEVHAGSFHDDALPAGYDLMTLVRILHDHDDDVAAALLANIRESLPPGGRLLIVEPMAGTPGARGMGDAYFGLYLWAMGSGRPRSSEANCKMLKQAGFSKTRLLPTPLPIIASAIVASI